MAIENSIKPKNIPSFREIHSRKAIRFGALSLRHHILIILVPVISGAIPVQDQGFTIELCD